MGSPGFKPKWAELNKLLTAAEAGDADGIRAALNDGALVNDSDRRGWPALVLAVGNRHTDCVRILLSAGAAVNVRVCGIFPSGVLTPLMIAAQNGYPDCMKILLDAGAEPNAVDNDGLTPLCVRRGLDTPTACESCWPPVRR